jgi:D-arabinose 1-dehydrogenase-like Zn-dependent alcohol dehydrogenase
MNTLRATVSAFARNREDGVASSVVLGSAGHLADHSPSPGEVVVEVKSAAVTYIDLLMLSGQYHHKPPLDVVKGFSEQMSKVIRNLAPVQSV